MKNQNELISSGLRRKRTRTLIQLGGLLEKSGLLQELNIDMGTDLQKDIKTQDQVALLYGGILEIRNMIQSGDYAPTLWKLRGKKELSK